MVDFLLQLFALVLLGGGIWWGYRYWTRSLAAPLNFQQQGLLLLILLTLVGGFLGAPFWWADLELSFSWDLPPLAGRMLASAGWAFVAACLLTLRQPTFLRLRLVVLMLFVYLVPLAIAVLLFHLDRFDPGAPITYAFFAVVGIMSVATTWYLLRPVGILPNSPRDVKAPGQGIRLYLGLVALITGLWGLALFLTDQGPAPAIWVWPGDLLTSRLIGVMLLTIAVSALYSLNSASLAYITLSVIMTYGLGVALASFWNLLSGRPLPLSYFLVFSLLFFCSGALLIATREKKGILKAQ